MLVVAFKSTGIHSTHVTLLQCLYFMFVLYVCTLCLYCLFCFVFNATEILVLNFNKKGPGGYLIRVDLIRFPGSIPGAIYRCARTDIH